MNTHFRPPNMPMTTQAAEGLPRRRWTVAEIEAMVESGILLEDERFELIDGEVVPMSPKGAKHEHLKASLNKWWMRRLPDGLELIPETTLRLNETSFLEPDFIFFRSGPAIEDLGPKHILLAVEVAVSSLRYELERKADIYARHGVATLWVIDAAKKQTHCFSKPSANGYLDRRLVRPAEFLEPDFALELKTSLAKLPMI